MTLGLKASDSHAMVVCVIIFMWMGVKCLSLNQREPNGSNKEGREEPILEVHPEGKIEMELGAISAYASGLLTDDEVGSRANKTQISCDCTAPCHVQPCLATVVVP